MTPFDFPIHYQWDGEHMVPLPRYARRCDQQFVVGMVYPLMPHEDRSAKSHKHYFAAIRSAWKTLPEDIAENFASPDHLRKWCLIKAGFRDERTIVCASKAEADRVKAFIKPMDQFAVVLSQAATVKVYTAASQSMRAMGKKDFQASKQAVLEIVAGMIGVDVETLSSNSKDDDDNDHRGYTHPNLRLVAGGRSEP